MNRNLKYDKDYRNAIICIVTAIATFSWIAITIAALSIMPTTSSIMGLSRTTATMTLFFVPTATGSALLLGLNYWLIAKGKRIGLYTLAENKPQAYKVSRF